MGDMVDFYDANNCSYYNLCNWKSEAEAVALPLTQKCSSTLTLRAQSMSASEMNQVCTSVIGEETYFHNKFQTNRVPVANDNNTSLELVVFDSSTDYQTYGGPLFGIDTNNGGIYIEGDPSDPSNQARFAAYEAEWERPTFDVWNLNHEYTHYLDGRFDMLGGFNDYLTTPTVWWIEGVAEHMSYCYRNLRYDDAMTQAGTQAYTLSQLFDTDYNSGQTRIYNWGYLAVSFLMERHRADISTLLGYFRVGNWTAARNLVKSTIGTRYDSEFRTWLSSVASTGVNCDGGSTSGNQVPTAAFNFTVSGLTATFKDLSTDTDGTIATRKWTFHDGTTSASANPSKTYAAAGTYPVRLDVTDNGGLGASVTQSVTVSGGTTTCPTRTDQMGNGCVRTNLSGAAGDLAYFFIYVDKPNATLTIKTSGGTGNADLFVSTSSWASPDNYNYWSTNAGNSESVTLSVPSPTYIYLTVSGTSSYSGLSLSTSY
jgi:microbial collagenase